MRKRGSGAGEEAQRRSGYPPGLLGPAGAAQGPATWVLRGVPHEPFHSPPKRNRLLFPHGEARGISQPVTAALGTGRTAPQASIPHHCHIIATGGLCDLGQITAPLWAFAPHFQAPLLRAGPVPTSPESEAVGRDRTTQASRHPTQPRASLSAWHGFAQHGVLS